MMGPIGKCLETALDELLADDQTMIANYSAEDDDRDRHRGNSTKKCNSDESNDNCNKSTETSSFRSNKKRKHATETTTIRGQEECESVGSANKTSVQENVGASEMTSNNNFRLDDAMSKSILESYSKAVAETKFDPERKTSIPTAPAASLSPTNPAPAAMLKGEIDYFNRVGGQWRIVVKNAVLKQRSTTKVDNGKTGRSLRKRTVLDWDDDDNACKKSSTSASDGNDVGENNGASSDTSDVHHFKGTIQILAYDDDT